MFCFVVRVVLIVVGCLVPGFGWAEDVFKPRTYDQFLNVQAIFNIVNKAAACVPDPEKVLRVGLQNINGLSCVAVKRRPEEGLVLNTMSSRCELFTPWGKFILFEEDSYSVSKVVYFAVLGKVCKKLQVEFLCNVYVTPERMSKPSYYTIKNGKRVFFKGERCQRMGSVIIPCWETIKSLHRISSIKGARVAMPEYFLPELDYYSAEQIEIADEWRAFEQRMREEIREPEDCMPSWSIADFAIDALLLNECKRAISVHDVEVIRNLCPQLNEYELSALRRQLDLFLDKDGGRHREDDLWLVEMCKLIRQEDSIEASTEELSLLEQCGNAISTGKVGVVVQLLPRLTDDDLACVEGDVLALLTSAHPDGSSLCQIRMLCSEEQTKRSEKRSTEYPLRYRDNLLQECVLDTYRTLFKSALRQDTD